MNSYDEYGIPGSGNSGRFQYTGQIWLSELGFQYSKARMYSPTLGRFLQTDPIGYGDGMNWYNYVGSDPVNKIDPSGLEYYDWGWLIDAPGKGGPGGGSGGGGGAGGGRGYQLRMPWDGSSEIAPGADGAPGAPAQEEPQKEQPKCPSGTFFTGTDSQGRALCAALPPPPPPKKPSYAEQCLNNAADNYREGRSFNSADLAGRDASRAGNAMIKEPLKTGGLNFGATAEAAAGLLLYNFGYYIGYSCPTK